jgi:hypothetical protein
MTLATPSDRRDQRGRGGPGCHDVAGVRAGLGDG